MFREDNAKGVDLTNIVSSLSRLSLTELSERFEQSHMESNGILMVIHPSFYEQGGEHENGNSS